MLLTNFKIEKTSNSHINFNSYFPLSMRAEEKYARSLHASQTFQFIG